MKVLIPSPLRSYTGASEVDAEGDTLDAVLRDIDRRHPGLRFRMVDEQDRVRPHVRVFVDGEQVFDLGRRMGPGESVQIVQALSGG
ncbi:MAG TPA: MoaD/ThiS family protein [Anaeromyxobacteraceae bacterium]|nr:MoaD/ThiS family protein [Anaeromyxobacteraceae bacterium]